MRMRKNQLTVARLAASGGGQWDTIKNMSGDLWLGVLKELGLQVADADMGQVWLRSVELERRGLRVFEAIRTAVGELTGMNRLTRDLRQVC